MHVRIANPQWRRKRSRHSRRMCNPHFYVSYKRPIHLLSLCCSMWSISSVNGSYIVTYNIRWSCFRRNMPLPICFKSNQSFSIFHVMCGLAMMIYEINCHGTDYDVLLRINWKKLAFAFRKYETRHPSPGADHWWVLTTVVTDKTWVVRLANIGKIGRPLKLDS